MKNLVKPLETVLNRPQVDVHLRVSALSILSTACQTCPAAMAGMLHALVDWVLNILEIEKAPEIRRGKRHIWHGESKSPVSSLCML